MRRANLSGLLLVAAISGIALCIHFAHGYFGPLQLTDEVAGKPARTLEFGPAAYPRRLSDSEGHTVVISAPPHRIVSLQWKTDEFLYSVVPPGRIVGVSPAAFERKYSNVIQWADVFKPAVAANAEVVLKLQPDLVVTSGQGNPDFTAILESAGIPVFHMFTMFTRLDEVAHAILLSGYLTGRDEKALRVHEEFQRTIETAHGRKPAAIPAPRVLGYGTGYSYGEQTLFHDIIRSIGAINVAAESGFHEYDSISTEQILRWNPEWIVSGANRGDSEATLRRLKQDPAIALTTAAKNHQIVVLDNNVFLPMSPFTALRIDAISKALYATPAEESLSQ